jgi:hypothetical protein
LSLEFDALAIQAALFLVHVVSFSFKDLVDPENNCPIYHYLIEQPAQYLTHIDA